MRTLVAYVPVLHEGYRRFFTVMEGPKRLYLFGPEITGLFPELAKEIRELAPEEMKKAIEALGIFESVRVLTAADAAALNRSQEELILPDEKVSHELQAQFFPEAHVIFSPLFLRWDKHNALAEKPVVPDERITHEEFHRRVLQQAKTESEKSSDIWRHVGAAIVKEGHILLVDHNRHLPSEHSPYVHGDPRSNFHKGEYIELSTAIHAEAGLIAEAARRGDALEGADMYVTVFPCPPCAKLIASAGIRNLYCGGGYGVLDGEEILKSAGVRVLFVE